MVQVTVNPWFPVLADLRVTSQPPPPDRCPLVFGNDRAHTACVRLWGNCWVSLGTCPAPGDGTEGPLELQGLDDVGSRRRAGGGALSKDHRGTCSLVEWADAGACTLGGRMALGQSQ